MGTQIGMKPAVVETKPVSAAKFRELKKGAAYLLPEKGYCHATGYFRKPQKGCGRPMNLMKEVASRYVEGCITADVVLECQCGKRWLTWKFTKEAG